MNEVEKMKARSDVMREWGAELEAWREQFESSISAGAVWADQFETWRILIIANGLRNMADELACGDAGHALFDRRDNEQRFAAAHVGPDRRGGES